ncbi:MAG: GIY-YIG nuclease family protein [Vicingaceae bacterium]|nr:GIY-YIG nuclease family protein [Vicingaceae bacterium]
MKYHCYFVYILKCNDNTYYTGVTNNIERRLLEHQSDENLNSYTHKRRPVELVFYSEFSNIEDAIEKEKQIKKWSKKKKEALISNNFDSLPILSKKTFNKKST